MAASCTNYSKAIPRCLLRFHKDSPSASYHAESYTDVKNSLNFANFPRKDVKTLMALEDLGRGETGKAWLCATPKDSSVRVLKNVNREKLEKEKLIWQLLYPQFTVKVEWWSGADALIMPHFATVLDKEHEEHREKVLAALMDITKEKKVHNDVRWSNIGKYSDKDGRVVIVLLDFDNMSDYSAASHSNWIDDSMTSLYGERVEKIEIGEEVKEINNSFMIKLLASF